jgi:hypothetical protein
MAGVRATPYQAKKPIRTTKPTAKSTSGVVTMASGTARRGKYTFRMSSESLTRPVELRRTASAK